MCVNKLKLKFPTLSFKEVAVVVATEWKKLPEDGRRPYNALAEVDQARFQREKAALAKESCCSASSCQDRGIESSSSSSGSGSMPLDSPAAPRLADKTEFQGTAAIPTSFKSSNFIVGIDVATAGHNRDADERATVQLNKRSKPVNGGSIKSTGSKRLSRSAYNGGRPIPRPTSPGGGDGGGGGTSSRQQRNEAKAKVDRTSKPCACCSTMKSPLWRTSENGVRFCNACGIRWVRHGIACTKCSYVPRKDESKGVHCPKCNEVFPPAVKNANCGGSSSAPSSAFAIKHP